MAASPITLEFRSIFPAPFPRPWVTDDTAAARLVLIPAGVTPVTLIAAAAFGVAGLHALALAALLPVLTITAVVVGRHRGVLSLIGVAVVAGLVATALYDAFRFSFVGLGLIHGDPIPHIGRALHLDPDWVFGYLWRYLGNGAGLAVAFFAIGLRGVRAGIVFGLFVCAGLLFTLVFSPYGEAMLFRVTPATVVMAIGGHIIFGAVLGGIADRHAAGASA